MHRISKLPYVTNVHLTEGRYELIFRVNAENEDNLKEIISKDINMVPGINATLSLNIA